MNFPRRAIIAPSSDVRQKVIVTFNSMDEVKNAQSERYEILTWLDQKPVQRS